jgi:hypothetical protein
MVVNVAAIFSYNDLIGSKIIANGTKHLSDVPKCSHVAVLVNDRWVHESTLQTGVRITSYEKWLSVNTEVANIPICSMEYQELADQFRNIQNKKYDWYGVCYLGLWILLSMVGVKIPKKNKLESKSKYFCCEVLGYLTGKYYGMSAPNQILESLMDEDDK